MEKSILYQIDWLLGRVEPFFLGTIILVGLIGNSFIIEIFDMKKFK